MKLPSCLLALSLMTAFAGKVAYASTIDFDNTPSGVYVTSPITQAGFTYSAYSGSLYIDGYGTYSGGAASHDLSGGAIGGVAQFRAVSGQFTFSSLDFAVESSPETITVTGYRGGSVVGVDTYSLPGQSIYIVPYYYTTELALNLAGVTLDSLLVSLPYQGSRAGTAIDNLILDPVVPQPVSASTPEPSSFVLLGSGLLAAAGTIRRRLRA